MKIKRMLVGVILALALCAYVEAQPPRPIVFDSSGTWERPRSVSYVMVAGCGAGGGGAPGVILPGPPYPEPKFANGGAEYGPAAGGMSGKYTSYLVGPLTAEEYEIVIGTGGDGGEAKEFAILRRPSAGGASTFDGADAPRLVFPGGAAGSVERSRIRDSSSPGADGEAGIGAGSGGKGGEEYKNGGDADGPCAGGGGTGPNRNSDNRAFGGKGGDGRIVIYPLRGPLREEAEQEQPN